VTYSVKAADVTPETAFGDARVWAIRREATEVDIMLDDGRLAHCVIWDNLPLEQCAHPWQPTFTLDQVLAAESQHYRDRPRHLDYTEVSNAKERYLELPMGPGAVWVSVSLGFKDPFIWPRKCQECGRTQFRYSPGRTIDFRNIPGPAAWDEPMKLPGVWWCAGCLWGPDRIFGHMANLPLIYAAA